MNDTETRLRDYLHTKAGTVPDSAHGPGLELDSTSTSTRRGWMPMALAAAGIAVVLTMAVPLLSSLTKHDEPSVAGLPAMGPVSDGAPRIPYAVTVENNPNNPLDTWWAVLHDGGKTVRNPGVKGGVLARVDGGWLVDTGYPDPKKSQAAVVSADGKVRPIGPLGAGPGWVSPDGRQVAVALSTYGQPTGRVVVIDVKSGKETSSITVRTRNLELFGWNKDGIWMNEHGLNPGPATVWRPGSKDTRTVKIDELQPDVERGTGTIAMSTTADGKKFCAKAATLGANGLEVKREYCYQPKTSRSPYLTMSPDGATMVSSAGFAVDVASGKVTELKLPAKSTWAGAGVFEDPDNVVLVDDAKAAQKIFRCSVVTGECKQIAVGKADESIALVKP
ncbi:hypothetical protein GCM10009804_38670 [Kribbella hippodromi]|uniref:Uncharacterized protein n=1 Tax=Kribbella hippodromi TaxID=434347 RepID=A0ABP4PDU8_9ACTN